MSFPPNWLTERLKSDDVKDLSEVEILNLLVSTDKVKNDLSTAEFTGLKYSLSDDKNHILVKGTLKLKDGTDTVDLTLTISNFSKVPNSAELVELAKLLNDKTWEAPSLIRLPDTVNNIKWPTVFTIQNLSNTTDFKAFFNGENRALDYLSHMIALNDAYTTVMTTNYNALIAVLNTYIDQSTTSVDYTVTVSEDQKSATVKLDFKTNADSETVAATATMTFINFDNAEEVKTLETIATDLKDKSFNLQSVTGFTTDLERTLSTARVNIRTKLLNHYNTNSSNDDFNFNSVFGELLGTEFTTALNGATIVSYSFNTDSAADKIGLSLVLNYGDNASAFQTKVYISGVNQDPSLSKDALDALADALNDQKFNFAPATNLVEYAVGDFRSMMINSIATSLTNSFKNSVIRVYSTQRGLWTQLSMSVNPTLFKTLSEKVLPIGSLIDTQIGSLVAVVNSDDSITLTLTITNTTANLTSKEFQIHIIDFVQTA